MQYNYYPQQPPPMPPMGPPPRRRKPWVIPVIILAAFALIVATVVIVITVNNRSDKQATPSTTATSTTSASSAVPGLLLKQEPKSGTPYRYGNTPIYNACSLLPIAELPELGLSSDLQSSAQRGQFTSEEVLDRNISAESAPGRASVSATSCNYPFYTGVGGVIISVEQEPLNDVKSYTGLPRQIAESYQENGLNISVVKPDSSSSRSSTSSNAIIASDQFAVSVTLAGRQSDQLGTLKKIVSKVSKRLASSPEPALEPSYAEPYQGIQDPCTLLTSADFQQTFQITERWNVRRTASLGEKNVRHDDNSQLYFIERECQRQQWDSAQGKGFLAISTRTWRTEDMAKTAHKVYLDPNSTLSKSFGVGTRFERIGDEESFATMAIGEGPAFTFRKGRTQVVLHGLGIKDINQFASKMIPIAKAVVARMK